MDKRYQVFVSSTYNDLIEERKEATQAILKCNCFPAGTELFPASNKQQWNVIKQVIDDSDFYLLILAGRYGSLGINDAGTKIGYTEMEFDYALSKGKPIIVMLHRHPETLPAKLTEKTAAGIRRLEKFRNKAMSGRLVAFWENKDQLNGEILNSLHKMMASTPEAVGWIRADNISLDDIQKPDIPLITEQFLNIKNAEDKIDYLDELPYKVFCKCFSNKVFVNAFVSIINITSPNSVICNALKLIPHFLGFRERKYVSNALDIKSIFFSQCEDGKLQSTELSIHVVEFLIKMEVHSLDYSEAILAALKTKDCSPQHKKLYINYIYNSRLYRSYTDEGKRLCEYILHEFNNADRILSIADLATLLTMICDCEESYVDIYNLFMKSERNIQDEIINGIFTYLDSETSIVTPRIQRMFLDMCETIYSWGEDKVTADLLLYCFFTRTNDVFTVDEIFRKVDEFNNDVFYLFFWNVGYGSFMASLESLEKTHDFDESEKLRIIGIIKNRNHPREENLLENLNKIFEK